MRFIANSILHKFILVISCFVLFILLTVCSTLYVVQSQSSDAEQLNIASRQSILILKMQAKVHELILALESASTTDEFRKQIVQWQTLFQQSLIALKFGGTVENVAGQSITLQAVDTTNQLLLANVERHWLVLETYLATLLNPRVDIVGDEFYNATRQIHQSWQPTLEVLQDSSHGLENSSKAKVYYLKIILFVALILTVVVAGLSVWFGQQMIVKPARLMLAALQNLLNANTDFEERLPHFGSDEIGQIAVSINAMRDNLQATYEQIRLSHETAQRLNQALDQTAANILISDNTHQVLYLNRAANALFKRITVPLRQRIPNFDPIQLKLLKTDIFPTHSSDFLEKLNSPHHTQLIIGELHLDVIISPVFHGAQRLGWVTEWRDRSAEIAIGAEVNQVIHAAKNGDFGRRVNLENKEGFYKTMSIALNSSLMYIQTLIEELHLVFNALATGNLNKTITQDYHGALADLKHNLNSTIQTLTNIIVVIQQTAENIHQVANEVTETNQLLGQRTEQHAAALQQVTANITQMTHSVQSNAINTKAANQMMNETVKLVIEEQNSLDKAIAAMNGFTTGSQRITDIVGVIDDIAFQTNLLALNSAIEAARAGEHGRSFSVVATEVRYLAQRSASAAKEIKALLEMNVLKMDEGRVLVVNSGTVLQKIAKAIQNTSELVNSVNNNSQSQAVGITEVNKVMIQMDIATQSDVSLSEEINNISQSLRQQATHLQQQVCFFNLTNNSVESSTLY